MSILSYKWRSSQGKKWGLLLHQWKIVYCGCSKNRRNDLVYLPVSTRKCTVSAHLFCIHTSLLASPWGVSSVSYINLIFIKPGAKPTGSITETCCWCRNCCQWSPALLVKCSSLSKTTCPNIALWHCQVSVSLESHLVILMYSQPTVLKSSVLLYLRRDAVACIPGINPGCGQVASTVW